MSVKRELIETKADGKPKYYENNIDSGFKEIKDNQKITDGYHTFEELYEHRCELFAFICNSQGDYAWKSKLHHDGTMFDNYFIVGIDTPKGQFTYHYHLDKWDLFDVKELTKAPEWDGHEAKDVTRLRSLLLKSEPSTDTVLPMLRSIIYKILVGCNFDMDKSSVGMEDTFNGTIFKLRGLTITTETTFNVPGSTYAIVTGILHGKEIVIKVTKRR